MSGHLRPDRGEGDTEGPSDTTEALTVSPTPEDYARAARKMESSPWIPMPIALMRVAPEVRLLTPTQYQVMHELLSLLWRGGGTVSSDATQLARIIGARPADVRQVLELFVVDGEDDARCYEPRIREQWLASQHRYAHNIARSRRAANARWDEDTRPEQYAPSNAPSNAPSIAVTNANMTQHDKCMVVPPLGGWEAHGSAVKAEAVRAVRAGLVVTALAQGRKTPPLGIAQRWATSESEVLSLWPSSPSNLGYQPGRSGFVEVDIDSAEGEAVAVELGCFAEPTYTVRTPRASLPVDHPKAFFRAVRLRFQRPTDFTFGKVTLRDSLEVFGSSGYVVAPPSWIGEYGAGYEVIGAETALPCPPRLADAIRGHQDSTTPADEGGSGRAGVFLTALSRHTGKRYAANRKKQYNASCPAHRDVTPSLRVKVLGDGGLVFHCHAGCHAADVLAALDLSWSDFYRQEAA